MVPRPGTTSPDDGMHTNQDSEARETSIIGSSTTAELGRTRPIALVDSEGTSTAYHEVSDDDEEAYEAAFAVPDVVPIGATLGYDSGRDLARPTPAKAKDGQKPDEKPPVQKKPKKSKRKAAVKSKKKMRAPGSDEDSPPKPAEEETKPRLTVEDLERGLCRSELARMMKKDPILKLLRPTLVSNLTGPVLEPNVASLTDVRRAVHATFGVLKDAGYALGVFDMERVYDWNVKAWKRLLAELIDLLSTLVGTVKPDEARTSWETGSSSYSGSTGSSRYHSMSSAVDNSDDDSDAGPRRMETVPRSTAKRTVRTVTQRTGTGTVAPGTGLWSATPAPPGIEDAFAKMMKSYAARHAAATASQLPGPPPEDQDEPMKSVGSTTSSVPDRSDYVDDPEDFFDLCDGLTGHPTVASATVSATTQPPLTRVRMSAFSELKEFSGRDISEEKARSWFNRVRSAARRDGMGPGEVCSLFEDLMSGSARQWYLQLGRETRTSWEKLTEQFLLQYCGKGVSMASRYYHATKRPDETPLEYLYHLNVAGIRAGLHFMEGSAQQKREHVEHYVRTLSHQEPDLAMQLTMLMVPDVPTLEAILRKRQRGLDTQKKSLFGLNKFRQKASVQATPPRPVHAVQSGVGPGSSQHETADADTDWDYGQDNDDEERARLCVATERTLEHGAERNGPTPNGPAPFLRSPCPHCNSTRHAQADCWKLLTCEKCGGHHPSDRCLRVCKACGDVHAAGECPMEEFFNLLRQWYDPTKHGGMLPPTAEQMLN